MGWFDKKSWQLRRKIRDLQSELAEAERDGKYVVCQGLFFAELAEMGNDTMMVLGKADTFDTEEEAIIKSFFERNGFSIETLRLDKNHKTLAAIEIIPPEEFLRRVARTLKDDGFKLIDDSESERPSALNNKMITLSSLIRAVSALFVSHVHNLIVTTPIKMNMEGNRLLHWMPLIRDALAPHVLDDLIDRIKVPFVDAYNHYYGRFGQIETMDCTSLQDSDSTEAETPNFSDETSSDFAESPWVPSGADDQSPAASRFNSVTAEVPESLVDRSAPLNLPADVSADRSILAAQTLSRIYKSLIGASEQRSAHNAEVVLDYVSRFFGAKSACLLSKTTDESPVILIANSNTSQCLASNGDGSITYDFTIVDECLQSNTVTQGAPSNGNTNTAAVAVPVAASLALYLVEPSAVPEPDQALLMQFAQVFREFPDLLISKTAINS